MKTPWIMAFVGLLLLSACDLQQQQTNQETAPGTSGDYAAFLDQVEAATFRYFWETTNPDNGLTPDRYPNPPFASIAAVGFALPAYAVGVERGYISRAEATERTLTTLRFFWQAPQGPQATGVTGYQGFYYHFLDMQTGERYQTVELSTIDTALLMGGVLFAQSYYDGSAPQETEIRALADSIYRRTDWKWFADGGDRLRMAWHPEQGFGSATWRGYNEAMLLLILSLGSPTHPLPGEAWDVWTTTYRWGTFYGQEFVQFSPLFGHQYSHIFIDFREIQDDYMAGRGIDYFENSRRATLAQQAYAEDNPAGFTGYGAHFWGLTACDGPAGITRTVSGDSVRFHTYWARGASQNDIRDDGTLAPTAAGGSIPFAPEICLPALKAMSDWYGSRLYGQYGFLDAFNPSFTFTDVSPNHGTVDPVNGWVDDNYLGIDEGPILLMAENYRSELVWRVLKQNKYIRAGLQKAGFTGGWLR